MDKISDLLNKYRNITPPDAVVRRVVSEVISCLTHIPISQKQIRVVRDSIYLSADPGIKNKLFLHKEEILEQIRKELGEKVRVREIQ